jgi:spermidine/putrescine-binding protein
VNIDEVISRREILRRGGIAAGVLSIPGLLAACGSEPPAEPEGGGATAATGAESPSPQPIEGAKIKVSTYGGFFEENFATFYPAFTKETGVEVESISEPTSEVWVVQLQQATDAGAPPPADVSMPRASGSNARSTARSWRRTIRPRSQRPPT